LRARYRELAAEDEAGHAFDARLLGGLRLAFDLLDVLVALERRAHILRVEADVGGRLHQDGVVGEIGALGEIEVHQSLFHRGRFADPFRPANQPVAVERIGLAFHFLGCVDETFLRRCRRDALCDALVALGRAELGGEVLFARYAFARDPVIEEIGPPVHFDRDAGREGDRLF